MDKKDFPKQKQNDFYKVFNNQVQKYTKNGASLIQAISLVCKKFKLNPYKVIDTYYPEIKNEDEKTYKDVKTEEGSFVTLNNDSEQNTYEVININNKDAIVLRNTDNNEEITASENEITPVITENKMNKLNEAQYNISINGLETQDAATLSQMLSLADQAENVGGSMLAPEAMQNGMALNPMPMDMDSGLPMDMNSDMSMNEPVDDIEFDEELPADTDISMSEPAEVDTDISVEEPISDMSAEDSFDTSMDNDLSSDMSMSEPAEVDTDISVEEPISDMSMDDMMDSGMYDNNIMGESFDYDALIKEAMEAANLDEADNRRDLFIDSFDEYDEKKWDVTPGDYGVFRTLENGDTKCVFYGSLDSCKEYLENHKSLNEAEETIPADEFIDDNGQVDSEQEDFAEELVETDFDSEIEETLKLAGVQLNEDYTYGTYDFDRLDLYNPAEDDGQDNHNQSIYDSVVKIVDRKGMDYKEAMEAYALWSGLSFQEVEDACLEFEPYQDEDSEDYEDSNDLESSEDYWDGEDETDFDSEIEETLKLAGVQLNEKMDNKKLSEGKYGYDTVENSCKSMIESILAYGGFGKTPEEILKSYYGERYLTKYVNEVGEEKVIQWIKEVSDTIEGVDNDTGEDSEGNSYNSIKYKSIDDEIEESINNVLRNAGVQLDEEVTDGPEVVNQKTLYINKDNEKEDKEPKYTEVDTTTFGKDASEGMKKSMTFEAAVNVKKIKSIYETAKSMYSKKDSSEWLSLDRRYVEKLIREGVGYEKASKMIMDAKKGK